MQSFIFFWNNLMVIAVFGEIIILMALIYTLLLPKDKVSTIFGQFISKNILYIGFLLSLAAMVCSLIYSDVIKYPPCLLCWWARIMFYPQVFLYGRAIIKKDFNIVPYSLILTVLGTIIMTYHSISILIGQSFVPCSAAGASCLTRDVYIYGFITIPFMALMGFAVLLLSIFVYKKNKTVAQ